MKHILVLLTLLLTAFFSIQAYAVKDREGSSDHSLISRYPGFYIKQYNRLDYDEAEIMVGAFNTKQKIADTKVIEGKVTNIKYRNIDKKMSVTALQLYKNYEKALKKLNAKFLLACRGTKCFKDGKTDLGLYIGNWFNTKSNIYKGFNSSFGREFGLLTATVATKEGGIIYVMIAVGADIPNKTRTVLMSFIEPEKLDTDIVGIGSPDDMQKSLDQTGKVELAGIFFDHNKASIKPESKETLDTITTYLKTNASSKFYVVGHTDNTGNLQHNMNLSKERSAAVTKALISAGINGQQLTPMGVGPLSPNASNNSEDGKALNRRVELVRN